VYKQAEECISLLATKLGDKDFFFGQSPTSLDAVVFAHLAPLLKAPLPSAALQNHLKACTNLSRFVGRILQRYFPKDLQGIPSMESNMFQTRSPIKITKMTNQSGRTRAERTTESQAGRNDDLR